MSHKAIILGSLGAVGLIALSKFSNAQSNDKLNLTNPSIIPNGATKSAINGKLINAELQQRITRMSTASDGGWNEYRSKLFHTHQSGLKSIDEVKAKIYLDALDPKFMGSRLNTNSFLGYYSDYLYPDSSSWKMNNSYSFSSFVDSKWKKIVAVIPAIISGNIGAVVITALSSEGIDINGYGQNS